MTPLRLDPAPALSDPGPTPATASRSWSSQQGPPVWITSLLLTLPGTSGPAQAFACGIVSVCTHSGGLLEWNDAEETWDDPLHGSRCSPDTKMLEGTTD